MKTDQVGEIGRSARRRKKPYVYKKEREDKLITVAMPKKADPGTPDFERLDRLLGASSTASVSLAGPAVSSLCSGSTKSEAKGITVGSTETTSPESTRNSTYSTNSTNSTDTSTTASMNTQRAPPGSALTVTSDKTSQHRNPSAPSAGGTGSAGADAVARAIAVSPASPAVALKYHGAALPLPRSKKRLRARTEQLMPLIPQLLAGKQPLSFYYTLAVNQRRRLPHAHMTQAERWDIAWAQYIGGFYGLRRQLYVGALVHARFRAQLARSTSKTILYWAPDMFCTYVLANEIILRLVMEDMGLDQAAAERLLRATVDYGCHVADHEELADDLEFELVLDGGA